MMSSRDARVRQAGSWLYWVAGMSAFNFIADLANWNFQFSLGLGVTAISGYFAKSGGAIVQTMGTVFTLVTIALMALLGFFACQGQKWAFIAGIVLLGLDTLLLLFGGVDMIIGIAIHIWAIVSLIMGMKALSGP